MKTTKTTLGILKDLLQKEQANLAELEKSRPIARATIEAQRDRILKLNHAINEYRLKRFLAPAIELKDRADRNSQVAREKVKKKKTHKGKSLEEIRKTEERIVADFQKARLEYHHLTENGWATRHAQEYGLSVSRVREILRKYR